MIKQSTLAVAVLMTGLALSFSAHAEAGLSIDAGTSGLGLHVSVPVRQNLNARFGVNFLNYSYSGNASNVDYDFKLKLKTFDALLDWYPTANAFHVTGGLVYNGTKIDAVAKPTAGSTYTFNGQTYQTSDVGSANGTIDFRKMAPYLGIGWGNALTKDKGWGFGADLGVLFQGSPSASLTAVCGPTAIAAPGGCATLKANVAAQQATLNDKMNDFKFYPIVRLSLIYRF